MLQIINNQNNQQKIKNNIIYKIKTEETKATINKINTLNESEIKLVVDYLGLNDSQNKTLLQLANELNKTRESVRQLLYKILSK